MPLTNDNLLASVEELSRNPGAAATSAKGSVGRQCENADAVMLLQLLHFVGCLSLQKLRSRDSTVGV